jgi:hypothetical protein
VIAVLPYVIHPKTAVLGRAGGVLTGAEAELLHPGWKKDKKGGVSDEEK